MTGPRRRADDHLHPEYWTTDAHRRFEDRMEGELEKVERAIESLKNRLTLMLGALMLIAFLLPVIAPFVRLWLDIPATPTTP